jgi:hypothetical protein
VIYESRPRRLSDGSEEVTLIVAPWGKRKRGLSMGDDSENHVWLFVGILSVDSHLLTFSSFRFSSLSHHQKMSSHHQQIL